MAVPKESLSLIEAVQELRREHGETVTYALLWRAVAQGDAPAVRVRNRWYIDRTDLPRAARALGLAAPATA